MHRYDRYWIGIVLGLLFPAVFGYLYIDRMNLWTVIQTFQAAMSPIMGKILMICIFPDMALIFLFYTLEWWKVSKGILIGALPYMLGSIMLIA